MVGTVALIAVTLALEAIGKGIAGGLYEGGNIGLEDESGILLAGLAWLTFAAVTALSDRRAGGVAR